MFTIYRKCTLIMLKKFNSIQFNSVFTDKQSLQDDLVKLAKWSEKWQKLFNFGKCKCILIGHGNMDKEYKMGDAVLGRTTKE